MTKESHVVIRHLHKPVRFILWPMRTFLGVLAPFLLGAIFGHVLVGMVGSMIVAYGVKLYNRHFGPGTFSALWYWYMPHSKSRMPVTPPSCISEFIGRGRECCEPFYKRIRTIVKGCKSWIFD